MAETRSVAVDQAVPDGLISFQKAIPDGSYRRGVRYPQWFLLLVVAVLGSSVAAAARGIWSVSPVDTGRL